MNKETKMTEQKKQAIIEQLWLTYYNDTLFAKGLITEEQRNKIRIKIKSQVSEVKKQDFCSLIFLGG